MPLGMIILFVLAVLIFLGLGQRVLDRLRLSDRAAIIFLVAMLVGGFLPDIPLTENVSINIGGGVIPLILAGYLLVKAGTGKEKTRAVLASLVTGATVYLAAKILPTEPTYYLLLDPLYVFAGLAGIAGYLAGRSRRSAFIAGISGIILADLFTRIELLFTGGRGQLAIGGAGLFDGVVISGFIALGLAEIVGEIRERAQGGPSTDRPFELLKGLSTDAETGEIDGGDEPGDHTKPEGGVEKNEEER
ncbi:MAG TPA: DUF1614 domain-containing protein [Firmicutes bacterium]|nr:DUF1614 domain-containing protein [Bacillota bacterium]